MSFKNRNKKQQQNIRNKIHAIWLVHVLIAIFGGKLKLFKL